MHSDFSSICRHCVRLNCDDGSGDGYRRAQGSMFPTAFELHQVHVGHDGILCLELWKLCLSTGDTMLGKMGQEYRLFQQRKYETLLNLYCHCDHCLSRLCLVSQWENFITGSQDHRGLVLMLIAGICIHFISCNPI